jgi:hypothetical protein
MCTLQRYEYFVQQRLRNNNGVINGLGKDHERLSKQSRKVQVKFQKSFSQNEPISVARLETEGLQELADRMKQVSY